MAIGNTMGSREFALCSRQGKLKRNKKEDPIVEMLFLMEV
jgi:hypothetical protein